MFQIFFSGDTRPNLMKKKLVHSGFFHDLLHWFLRWNDGFAPFYTKKPGRTIRSCTGCGVVNLNEVCINYTWSIIISYTSTHSVFRSQCQWCLTGWAPVLLSPVVAGAHSPFKISCKTSIGESIHRFKKNHKLYIHVRWLETIVNVVVKERHSYCDPNKRILKLYITLDSYYKVPVAEWPTMCSPLPTDTGADLWSARAMCSDD